MTKVNGRAYFAPGRRIRGESEQRQAGADELLRLYNSKNKGRPGTIPARLITPEEIVRRATDSDNPLHPLFEWDDTEAAREHRLWQARTLLGAFRIEVEEQKPPVRLQNVVRIDDGEKTRGYVALSSALSNEPDRAYVIREAVGALQSWDRRYGHMDEFASVVSAIRSLDLTEMISEAVA